MIEPVVSIGEGTILHLEPSLHGLTGHLRSILLEIDAAQPVWRNYSPGIGAFPEPELLNLVALGWNRTSPIPMHREVGYPDLNTRCDIVVGDWAVEVKFLRPFNNNGTLAEHWSESVLHPYPGSVSAISDALKLWNSKWSTNKAIVIIAFEPDPSYIDLNVARRSFECLLKDVAMVSVTARTIAHLKPLVHPIHQQAWIYGYQLAHHSG